MPDELNNTKIVNAKVLHVTLTTAQWTEQSNAEKVISKGQIVLEKRTDGSVLAKAGDGVNVFANLPYLPDIPSMIDSTLTQTGKLADAKAVGDALANVTRNGITAIAIGTGANLPVVNGKVTLPATTNSADSLTNAINVTLTGAVTGSVNTDLSSDVTLNTVLTNIDASKITSGTIDIERLPHGALERLHICTNDTARFNLTSNEVQNGDTVKVTSTGLMYYVVDDTNLDSEDGYEPYTAGSATSVPWSGVTNKPNEFTPSAHNHTLSDITDYTAPTIDSALSNSSTNAVENQVVTNALDTKVDKVSGKQLSTEDFTTALKTKLENLDTSALVTGVKGDSENSYRTGNVNITKENIGLSNVTNDRQVKGLSSGTTQGHILVWGADGYTVADSGIELPANPQFTDTTYTIDSVLNNASTNPIQNMAVTNALDAKANQTDLETLEGRVDTIEDDYLKSTDTLILNSIL